MGVNRGNGFEQELHRQIAEVNAKLDVALARRS